MIHTSNIKTSSTDIITPRFLQAHVETSNLKEIHNSSQLHYEVVPKSLISSIVHGAYLVIYCRYAVILSRNNGLMQTPAKIQSRKRKGSPGPSAPRPQTPGPAQPGPVPVGRIQAKRMHCNDATGQWSAKTWRYMGCSTTGWRRQTFHANWYSFHICIGYNTGKSVSLSLYKYGWITVIWYAMTWPDNSWYRGKTMETYCIVALGSSCWEKRSVFQDAPGTDCCGSPLRAVKLWGSHISMDIRKIHPDRSSLETISL